MTDARNTPETALAAMSAALETVDVQSGYRLSNMTPRMGPTTLAAAILTALTGWTLVPNRPGTFSYEGALQDAEAEIERLRADLEAACLAMEAATPKLRALAAKLREVGR
jgi:hypothetical protein